MGRARENPPMIQELRVEISDTVWAGRGWEGGRRSRGSEVVLVATNSDTRLERPPPPGLFFVQSSPSGPSCFVLGTTILPMTEDFVLSLVGVMTPHIFTSYGTMYPIPGSGTRCKTTQSTSVLKVLTYHIAILSIPVRPTMWHHHVFWLLGSNATHLPCTRVSLHCICELDYQRKQGCSTPWESRTKRKSYPVTPPE